MKRILLLLISFTALNAGAQVSDLQSQFPLGNNPTIFPTQKTYTTCGYAQENNAFENGRVSNVLFPLVCADDFVIPAGQCWNIESVAANFFTNNPTDATAMNINFYADAGGVPGAIVGSYAASPADWSTSLLGNNFSIDVHEYLVNIPAPINLCGGATGTTYWFSIEAVNTISSFDFYWETVNTASPYGNNGVNGPSTAGPWVVDGLDNFVFELNPAQVTNLTMTECPGFSITIGTNTYTTTGITQDILTSSQGCDSIVNLDLTILPPVTGTDTQVACDSLIWIDGLTYYTNNTTATHNIVGGAANGCDSLVTLNLTVNNSSTGTDTQVACDSLIWIDGLTYYATNNSATHNISGGAANGCDSLVTLDLTILNSATGTDTQTACDSLVWIDGLTYYANNNTATHNLSGGAANGCDSLVTLDLTILNSTSGTDTQVACDSLVWIDGITYYADNNTATFNIVGGAANTCDSLVTLNLTVVTGTTGTDTQTACDSLVWIDGNTYSSDNNTATFNIVGGAANSCDSLVTLDLTIVSSPLNTVTLAVATLTADQAGATYQWLDCDNGNSPIAGETNQSYTPTATGNYAVEIILNGCTSTSSCTLVDFTSIDAHGAALISVYPNPTNGYIKLNGLNKLQDLKRIEILSTSGALVGVYDVNSQELDISNLAKGVYFLNIVHSAGVESVRIIKE